MNSEADIWLTVAGWLWTAYFASIIVGTAYVYLAVAS
jgi:hypothetical protein